MVDLIGVMVFSGVQLDFLLGVLMFSVFVLVGGVFVGFGMLYVVNIYNEVVGMISGVYVGDVFMIYGQLFILFGGVVENIQVICGGMFVVSGGLVFDMVLYLISILWLGSELGVVGIVIFIDIVFGLIVIVNDGGIVLVSMILFGGLVLVYFGGVDFGLVVLSGGFVIV